MKGTLDTHLGNVAIDNNVIAEYAGGVALECYGVAGMAGINVAEGVASILKKDSLGKGISVSLDIIVAFGVSIQAVASNVMSEVKYNVEQFAGLDVEKVNVFVEGVALVDKED